MLRKKGVVGKFVEFYGVGLDHLTLEDRATIANMAPEYGATCGFFPIDAETVRYLKATGRDAKRIALVEAYAKEQGLFRTTQTPDPVFTDSLELDLSKVEPSLAGPKRPQDRVALGSVPENFSTTLVKDYKLGDKAHVKAKVPGTDIQLGHGDVVIAAITSCTNTSNPNVMVAAGLVARKAIERAPEREALGQDVPRARGRRWFPNTSKPPVSKRTWMHSASTSSAMAARPASVIPGRFPTTSATPSPKATSPLHPSFRATATSRAASTR